jgi:DNA-binding CsgD family transcriptional regulator
LGNKFNLLDSNKKSTDLNDKDKSKSIAIDTLKQFKKLNLNKDIGNYLDDISAQLQLMEEMQIGVFIIDYSTGKCLYFNNYLKQLLGISKIEVIRIDSYAKHLHPDDIIPLFQILTKTAKTLKTLDEQEKSSVSFKVNYRIKTNKGRYSWVMQMNKIILSTELLFPIDLGFIIPIPDNSNFSEVVGYLKSDQNSWVLKYKKKINHDLIKNLSEREIEVLNLASKGHQTKEIASILEISFQTIKIHKRNILKKLDVSSTLEAIKIYEKKRKS